LPATATAPRTKKYEFTKTLRSRWSTSSATYAANNAALSTNGPSSELWNEMVSRKSRVKPRCAPT